MTRLFKRSLIVRDKAPFKQYEAMTSNAAAAVSLFRDNNGDIRLHVGNQSIKYLEENDIGESTQVVFASDIREIANLLKNLAKVIEGENEE